MFHLSLLTQQTHPELTDIQQEVQLHPKRNYRLGLKDYTFTDEEIDNLLVDNCGLCIHKVDEFVPSRIDEVIEKGKSNILIYAMDFEHDQLLDYSEKGAEVLVGKADGFDIFQITQLINKGEQHTLVNAIELDEPQLKDFIEAGATILVKKDDISPFAITRLLKIENVRMIIHGGEFSSFRIEKFLKANGTVHFGEGTLISQPAIEAWIPEFPNQIQINLAHYEFDIPWIERMELLGAVIV